MKKQWLKLIIAMAALIILILDGQTAATAASEGLRLCIQSLIPTMLPFLLVSILLSRSLQDLSFFHGSRRHTFSPLCATLFLLGLISGYPAGAQAVANACSNGCLSKQDAKKMIVFCNNAGPAFLLGFGATVIADTRLCLLLWLVQICAAFLTGLLLKGFGKNDTANPTNPPYSISMAMRRTLETMAMICGWVICFRVLITFLQKWMCVILSGNGMLLLTGLLELSNGSMHLLRIQTIGLRIQLFSIFLGFGGLCVTMQTASIAENAGISMGYYWPGKILQGCICFLLTLPLQLLLAPSNRWQPTPISLLLCIVTGCISLFFIKKPKKAVAFAGKVLYNKEKITT